MQEASLECWAQNAGGMPDSVPWSRRTPRGSCKSSLMPQGRCRLISWEQDLGDTIRYSPAKHPACVQPNI